MVIIAESHARNRSWDSFLLLAYSETDEADKLRLLSKLLHCALNELTNGDVGILHERLLQEHLLCEERCHLSFKCLLLDLFRLSGHGLFYFISEKCMRLITVNLSNV